MTTPARLAATTAAEGRHRWLTLTSLAKVKAEWGISIKGLVGRFKSLGVINALQAESLYKQISARRWTKAEPVEVQTESAQWFPRSLTILTNAGELASACGLACSRIGGNIGDLTTFVDWTHRDADVVRLSDRSTVRGWSGVTAKWSSYPSGSRRCWCPSSRTSRPATASQSSRCTPS